MKIWIYVINNATFGWPDETGEDTFLTLLSKEKN